MKKFYLILIGFCFSLAQAQNITFTDSNLKAKLLEASIENGIARDVNQNYIAVDANSNGEIEVTEAQNVYHLFIGVSEISSLTGIQNFSNLQTLDASQNYLSTFSTAGLTNLRDLTIGGNPLTSLDVSGLPNLQYLSVYEGNLTTLNLTGITSLLSLDISYNNLSTLDVSQFPGLTSLNCTDNNLQVLDLSGLSNLEYLDCSYNVLTTLYLSGCSALNFVSCVGNQLTILDLSDSHPQMVDADYNQLTTLIIKNGFDDSDSYINFAENNIQYICVDEAEVTAYIEIADFYGYNASINTYCSFEPGGTSYTISGSNTFDADNNGCDDADPAFENLRFSINNGSSGQIVADGSGEYNIAVPAGSYTIAPVLENPSHFNVTPQNITVSFPSDASPVLQDFCISPNGVHPDLEVVIIPLTPSIPGFDSEFVLFYRNKGNQVQSGSITLTFEDDYLDLIASEPAVSNQTPNVLTWNFTNLFPGQSGEVALSFSVNEPGDTPPVAIDDQLDYTATITSTATDDTPEDNTDVLNEIVVGAFDPNDITCIEGNIVSSEVIGNYVHYMIRFENTGTFAAQNVVVRDVINTSKFDINSLVPLTGSHNFYTRISNNRVEFIFENIQLAFDDQNNDGFLVFKIKTKSNLTVGSSFSNSASIYFDYNLPIVTNTETTVIQELGIAENNTSEFFSVYPNPANDILNLNVKENIILNSIQIYNPIGQLLMVIPDASAVSDVDVSHLQSGTYFIKVNSDQGSSAKSFIIR
ncbi:MAG TPA: T9SS type A sorting domain-containing protein [Flavobacterium sp.]|jgi:hypothetical protein